MFDLANQSFTLIINTLLFGVFLATVALNESAADPDASKYGDLVWALFGSVSLGIVVLLSPVLGAMADARAAKKTFLIGTGVCCAILTCGLSLTPSGAAIGIPAAVAIAALLYIPANVAFNVGENFLASFLPEIATRDTVGRISAIGWTMGYVGALMLLVLLAVLSAILGIAEASGYRPLLLFAGLWFGAMLIPTMLFLPERATADPACRDVNAIKQAFGRIAMSWREAAQFRDLLRLLIAFLVYGMGVQVIVFFGGKIAKDDFGLETTGMAVFLVTITLAAAGSAVLLGRLQDRIGHARAIFLMLAVWIATSLLLAGTLFVKADFVPKLADFEVLASSFGVTSDAALTDGDLTGDGAVGLDDVHALAQRFDRPFPRWPLWLAGIGIGIGLGGVGTATRAAVGSLTPAHRAAEFFGLWGATYKLAGVVGLPIFGAVRAVLGSTASFIILAGFFLIGGLILLSADFRRGRDAADASEKEHLDEIEPEDVIAGAG
jgi:UMF1 family MFS transporter